MVYNGYVLIPLLLTHTHPIHWDNMYIYLTNFPPLISILFLVGVFCYEAIAEVRGGLVSVPMVLTIIVYHALLLQLPPQSPLLHNYSVPYCILFSWKMPYSLNIEFLFIPISLWNLLPGRRYAAKDWSIIFLFGIFYATVFWRRVA